MLDKTFHHNNKLLHLIESPTPSLEYILVKVRQELIQAFQKLKRKSITEDEIIIKEVEKKP